MALLMLAAVAASGKIEQKKCSFHSEDGALVELMPLLILMFVT